MSPADIVGFDGRCRVQIARVTPVVDGGRHPAKRVIGDVVSIRATLFADGHDVVAADLRARHSSDGTRRLIPMRALGNDRFAAELMAEHLGVYHYDIEAFVDHFATVVRDADKRVAAQKLEAFHFARGVTLLERAIAQAEPPPSIAQTIRTAMDLEASLEQRHRAFRDPALAAWMREHAPRPFVTLSEPVLEILVEPPRARFSAWYELFPRSTGNGTHGTFITTAALLPHVKRMGFDVLYLPPIHPIGRTHRKGRNNATTSEPSDPGSPWAIGSDQGGHKSIHPALGTEQDFTDLLEQARALGIEVALDLAFQCSPDHPYVKAHPEWFKRGPDGRIQYAENPPKKYEDIYPFDFECDAWQALWAELLSVVLHWCTSSVRVFRVDNPHTKPLAFWRWLIAEVRQHHPDVIFLAEAFTRPGPMQELAKIGFSQSYTYFPWRNTKREIEAYFTELTQAPLKEFFRSNAWPNTPDILPELLQHGGRAAFITRFVLAATLSASYGIYGPAFELNEHVARPGSEEYIDNEKYELKRWNTAKAAPFCDLITIVNRTRNEHTALQRDDGLVFHPTTNEQLICYSKRSVDGKDVVIVVVNLDPHHKHTGFVTVPHAVVGGATFQAHDVLSAARYHWHADTPCYVELDPAAMPAHLFIVRHKQRTEHDFEYFS